MCNLIFSMLYPMKTLSESSECAMEQISIMVILPLSLLAYALSYSKPVE